MGIFNKVAFAALGAIISGPVGAAIGVALEHIINSDENMGSSDYDKIEVHRPKKPIRKQKKQVKATQKTSRKPKDVIKKLPDYNTKDREEIVFIAAVFAMLGKLAKIDGIIAHDEIIAIDNYIKNKLKLDKIKEKLAKEIFYEAKNTDTAITAYAEQFYNEFKNEKSKVNECFELLFSVAAADGGLQMVDCTKTKKIYY